MNKIIVVCGPTASGKTALAVELAKLYDIRPENIYCAGDEENDLSMLEIAAEAFIPSDCNPLIKGRGFTEVGPCTERAVADMIAALEKKYPAKNVETILQEPQLGTGDAVYRCWDKLKSFKNVDATMQKNNFLQKADMVIETPEVAVNVNSTAKRNSHKTFKWSVGY